MKSVARVSAVLFAFFAAITLGCVDTQPSAGPRGALAFNRATAPGLDQACSDQPGEHLARRPNAPDALLCVIAIPGNPILSGTKSWVDDEKYYLTDVSNASVDIIDAENNAYLGRVTGFIGATGNAATSGPNSIVFTGDGHAWVSDGISVVRVVDLASMSIVATISTTIAACDNATVHNCQRTNEITFDPEDGLIFVQNPSPLDTSKHGGTTFPAIDTYSTFVSATAPYAVKGHITFADRRGQEAPLWDADLHRILSAVSGRAVGTTIFDQYVAVIDPKSMTVENKYPIDCHALVGAAPGTLFGINDPSLGPNQKLVIPGCGKALIMDATNGNTTVVTQVGGGNETWYNPGDNRFYVTGADATTGHNSLGVIDASTGTWLQSVPAVQATNPTALAENNRIFAVVQVTAAQVAGTAADTSACAAFGLKGQGCVTVFAHVPGSN